MKITKYEHSCLVIEDEGEVLVIDPGSFFSLSQKNSNIKAIVVTHFHPDHFSPSNIESLINQNPGTTVFTTAEVTEKSNNLSSVIITTGQTYRAGSFRIEFFGGEHAVVNPKYPLAQNFGVLINNTLYYPGDSVTLCPKPYKILGAPIMGPWLKFSESFELLKTSSAATVIPMHTGFINGAGEELYKYLFTDACKSLGKKFVWLNPGESINS